MSIQDDILSNPFIADFRELRFNKAAYGKLCAQLRQLRREWAGSTNISKKLMQELYVLPWIVRGVGEASKEINPKFAALSCEVFTEIDNLILECLGS